MANQINFFARQPAGTTTPYFARIMRPSEVAAATEGRPSAELVRYAGNWVFCGDVATGMFELLRSKKPRGISFRITGFRSSLGSAYAVLTHQIANQQHRFLMPLYEPIVAECVTALRTQGHSFLLSNDNQDDAVVLSGEAPGVHFLPLLGLHTPLTPEDAHDALLELPAVVGELTDPSTVPTMMLGQAVDGVSLSVLMPSVTLKAVSLVLGGRKH